MLLRDVDCAAILESDIMPGANFQLLDECRIHRGAHSRQRFQSGISFRIVGHEHSCGCATGLAARLSPIENRDGGACASEFNGDRKTYDSGAGDDYIAGVHKTILAFDLR